MILRSAVALTGALALAACGQSEDAAQSEAAAGSESITEAVNQAEDSIEAVEDVVNETVGTAVDLAEQTALAGIAFLEENAKKDGVIQLDSGLQYLVLEKGDGEGASPSATDQVRVHYHGTLIDGTVFDSSVERGQPAAFPLNGVIRGWTEGVQLMQEGDKYRFFLPPELAYGARGSGPIGPNSTLIFDVELLEVLQ